MFISRVELPWEAVRNPYHIHQRLWQLFPGCEREARKTGDEPRQGFLFRVEEQATGRPARLLLQSRLSPAPADGIQLLGSREFLPMPAQGQRLAFVLTANPVKTIVDAEAASKPDKLERLAAKQLKRPENPSSLPKSRVPLIQEEEQRDWLIRRLLEAAELESVEILPHPPLYFRKGNRGGKLVTCTFEGVLHVKSPEQLVNLLENGVGPAKAFGCGLMLVRRA